MPLNTRVAADGYTVFPLWYCLRCWGAFWVFSLTTCQPCSMSIYCLQPWTKQSPRLCLHDRNLCQSYLFIYFNIRNVCKVYGSWHKCWVNCYELKGERQARALLKVCKCWALLHGTGVLFNCEMISFSDGSISLIVALWFTFACFCVVQQKHPGEVGPHTLLTPSVKDCRVLNHLFGTSSKMRNSHCWQYKSHKWAIPWEGMCIVSPWW